MPRAGWLPVVLLIVGCHGPSVVVRPAAPRSTAPTGEIELSTVKPDRIEPTLAGLPTLDARTADPSSLFAADAAGFQGLDETGARLLAARQSPLGNLLDRENERPTIQILAHAKDCPDPTRDDLLRQLRTLAALEARHRDAADAIDRFYQLADAEARTELLSAGLKAFDELRAMAPRLRAAGLPVPDEDELTRQRAKLLVDLDAAEAGIKLLNVDLRTRLGLSVKGTERLWPTGSFEVEGAAVDSEAAVAIALESRSDLQLLRALYHGANEDTLPVIGEHLKSLSVLAGATAGPVARTLFQRRGEKLTAELKAATQAQVEIRKQQLFDLIAAQEKRAAAEVRTAALQMAGAARRIALAKGRADSWKTKIEKAKADDKPYDRLPLELEWYKARADLVQEVMAWHRWHARFRAAQGTLLDFPPAEKPGDSRPPVR
jgi:hypothetical protein